MGRLITLLTDFGTQDSYVGVMKGVIATLCPAAQVIDLSHAIPPQDLYAARFNLLSAYPFFPPGTIHLVVVDPGVGTDRRGIAIELADGLLVGPDNGVFGGVLQQHSVVQAVELANPLYWRGSQPSATFHGRDIFAPVAAHLATGVPIGRLGPLIPEDSLTRLALPPLVKTRRGLEGTIQHIDHFGNGITTIPARAVTSRRWGIEVGNVPVAGMGAYGEISPGEALALVGSHGWVEIAVNQGSARHRLGLAVGDRVVWIGKPCSP